MIHHNITQFSTNFSSTLRKKLLNTYESPVSCFTLKSSNDGTFTYFATNGSNISIGKPKLINFMQRNVKCYFNISFPHWKLLFLLLNCIAKCIKKYIFLEKKNQTENHLICRLKIYLVQKRIKTFRIHFRNNFRNHNTLVHLVV